MNKVFIIERADDLIRLDVFLSDNIDGVTRSQIKKSIDEGKTLVNGKIVKAGKILKLNDIVEFEEAENEMKDVLPENIPLDIVYEDNYLAVINKPQGMTVHPAPGNYTGTLVNALLYHLNKTSDIGGKIRPGIVHRIDKDTSGLLVVAKDNNSHLNLAKQIANKECKRTYIALLEGNLKSDEGVISTCIGRDPKDRKKMAVTETGKIAITHYKVIQRFEGYTLCQFDLETGRTHQIRVHSKYIGHPIVGDPVYGYQKQKFKTSGQLLHAKKLVFTHPFNNKRMEFECEEPIYFKKIVSSLKKIKE